MDVGTTRRRSMTPARRLKIWERHKGICCLCERTIDGARDRWYVEHLRALVLGGPDEDDNCAPAHYACKPEKDAADIAAATKAKHVKERHVGAHQPKRPMPFGRFSKFKRKMDGTIVPRRPK